MEKRLTILALLLFVLIGMAFGCASAPSHPPAPPQACVAVHVHGETGFLVGATVTVAMQTINTVEGGYGYFYPVTPGPVTIHAAAPGYDATDLSYIAPVAVPGGCDIDVILHQSFVPLPKLKATGQFFSLDTGPPFTAIEASDFHLLGRFLSGEDIEPILSQRASIGFNLLRVWTRYQLAQYGIGNSTLALHPDLYARIPAFLRACAKHGIYVEFTAYTGREDYDFNHWSRLQDAVRSETNVLLELVNENDQSGNHIETDAYARPTGILASHGSNGSQAPPVQPFWDYVTFHTNGAPEEARKVGHNAMELWNGPSLTNETSRYPDAGGMWAGGDPTSRAYDAAAGAALLASGSAFHSVEGKNSTLFSPETERVARAWVAGAKSVPLDCRGGYVHRADLEGSIYLRVYQRGSDARCIVSIRP